MNVQRAYINVLILSTLFAVAAGMLAFGMGGKPAFLVACALTPGYLSLATSMALRVAIRDGRPMLAPTPLWLSLMAMVIFGVTLWQVDVAVFLDAAVEGVVNGIAGTALGVIGAFIDPQDDAKK